MNTYYVAGGPVTDELYHYGILGMHWGERRFQNADGTLTAAGRERYGTTKSKGDGKEYYTNKELRKITREDLDNARVDFSKIDHGEKGSKSPLTWYALNVGLDLLTLNPVYAAMDIYRGARYVDGAIKSKQYEKEREGLETDKTTGFKIKDKAKSLSPEEDLKRVNPDLYDFNTNSKNNCMLCTMTTEMRRRGYDVTAKKSGNGYYDNEISRWLPGAKIQRFGAPNFKEGGFINNATGKTNKAFAENVVSKILKSQPNGARGNLTVYFTAGGGHSMFYEIQNGQMIIRDGQISKTFKDPVKILKQCRDINVCRMDNLAFDPEAIKECCRS